jgi:hypothetical protein
LGNRDLRHVLRREEAAGTHSSSGAPQGAASIYSLQSLEIWQIIYQAPPPPAEGEEAPAEQPVRVAKTIILAIDPQDATVLKYAIDTQAAIDLALRAEENERLFEVDPVTINTLSDRYDFSSPRPVP